MAKTKGAQNVPEDQKTRIFVLHEVGHKPSEIAKTVGITRSTVKGILRRNRKSVTAELRKERGSTRKCTPEMYQKLIQLVEANNSKTLIAISTLLQEEHGVQLSTRTIRRYLHEYCIESYVAAAKPFPSPKHIEARLQWCILRKQWTTNQWEQLAFSDETTFTLRPLKNHLRIWRKKGKLYLPTNIVPTFKSGSVSLSV